MTESRARSHDDIMEAVRWMQRQTGASGDSCREEAVRRFPDIALSHPRLFEMACRPGLDMGMLEFIIESLRKHGPGDRAEREVGEKLADVYIRPLRKSRRLTRLG
jgi:hypothetical protein